MELLLKACNEEVKELYVSHSQAYMGDSGLDLFFPEIVVIPAKSTVLVDFQVCCEMVKNSTNFSYFLMPRSSIYKTPLRMANSVGLIDAGYRNSLKVPVDNISDTEFIITKGQRLFQIVAGTLENFTMNVVETLSETNRGSGFGSSGK
ncbi:MAG TPA: hypothetical protein V6C58_12205 [Allocoleopsis sp.]